MNQQFGTTWWGEAWTDALEQRATRDPSRLPRGRTYARQGRVGRLELEPGKVTALVRGGRALPYRVTLTVPLAGDDALDRFARVVAARAASAAALLDHELDPQTVDDAAAAGLALLPGTGELSTRCSCPDLADPCKHAAAVCYLVAGLLDADPFELLRLRGIEREPLLARVRAVRAGEDAEGEASGDAGAVPSGRRVAAELGGGSVIDPGTPARDAWARVPDVLPRARELPTEPGTPAPWASDPPRDAPFTVAGLAELIGDAAGRAWAQLANGTASGLDLGADADLARRAATRLDRLDELLALARRSEVPDSQLVHRALAWRSAGSEGLAAVDEARWRPPTEVIDRGLAALAEAGFDDRDVSVRSNRLTAGEVQLRVTEDERWWRYELRGRSWELVEPPSDDPLDLVDT